MNRVHTVWLDQLQSQPETALSLPASSLPVVALPTFTLELVGVEAPQTKKEGLVRFIRFLFNNRYRLVALYAVYRLLRKLHQLSRSQQDLTPAFTLPGDSPSLIPPSAFITSISTGVPLYTRSWRVEPASRERGRLFLIHAYREHVGRYGAFAQKLNEAGFSVFGMDNQGHGRSGGARGYVESFTHYVQDYLEFMTHTLAKEPQTSSPIFLYGHSSGGTIALQIARIYEWRRQAEMEDREQTEKLRTTLATPEDKQQRRKSHDRAVEEDASWIDAASTSTTTSTSSSSLSSSSPPLSSWRLSGVIVSSPALLPDTNSASPLMQALASGLADIVPRFGFSQVLPLNLLSDEPEVVRQFYEDPLVYKGHMVARWGHEILEAMSDVRNGAHELTIPIFIGQAKYDRIVSPLGAQYLFDHVSSTKKQLQYYEATHDLYLDVERDQFIGDVTEWLQRQTITAPPTAVSMHQQQTSQQQPQQQQHQQQQPRARTNSKGKKK